MEKIGKKKIGFQPRPPIVVVLGHVDHGKTTLLDKIRQTNIAPGEPGGITQHINTYQITYGPKPTARNPRPVPKAITFIDTPGHIAFAKMRSQGAKVADLALLVIAADEGVKPQTLESLKYIQDAKINYLIAINKIDLPNTNIERVKKLLSKSGMALEGYGGDIVAVPVSAKTGTGVDDLLEMILLLAEMADLKCNSEGELEAVIIESRMDRQRGAITTVLVRNGSLKIGDQIKVGNISAKVRALFSPEGDRVKMALPGQPVEVLGFGVMPPVGGRVEPGAGLQLVEELMAPDLKELPDQTLNDKRLKIILKADVLGTLEAIKTSLPEECQIIRAGVGDVNGSDVSLAETVGAEVIAFNVRLPNSVKKLAEIQGIRISQFEIIYELLKAIEEMVLKKTGVVEREQILGRAQIIAEFKTKDLRIAGCKVLEGEVNKQSPIYIKRGEKVIGNAKIKSLRIGKKDVEGAAFGEEFGVIFNPLLDFALGDMLVSFQKLKG